MSGLRGLLPVSAQGPAAAGSARKREPSAGAQCWGSQGAPHCWHQSMVQPPLPSTPSHYSPSLSLSASFSPSPLSPSPSSHSPSLPSSSRGAMAHSPLRQVTVEGPPFEMGAQIGRHVADLIQARIAAAAPVLRGTMLPFSRTPDGAAIVERLSAALRYVIVLSTQKKKKKIRHDTVQNTNP